MRLEIKFIDDNGEVVLEHKANAEQPSQWKSTDKIKAGQYEIYGFSYQPHVRCLYPNGQPPPTNPMGVSPFNGQRPSPSPGMYQFNTGMASNPGSFKPFQGDNGPTKPPSIKE